MKHSTKLLIFFLVFILAFLIKTRALLDQSTSTNEDDPYKLLHLIKNPDGSIIQIREFYPTVPPNISSSIALSKDVPLNPHKKTWVRIYLPNKSDLMKLPILVYAHGGGFIVLSAASPKFDSFLSNTASQLAVLVVSVEYRLAPEHRLPAAYYDVLEALHWVKGKKDVWIKNYGDVTKCILMGESAGGNIVYNVGLLASTKIHKLNPLVIRGLVLIQPRFGQVKRTGSELRLWNSTGLPLVVTDFTWNMSLPLGANRNHPYSNPNIHGGSRYLNKFKELGWRVAIVGCDGVRLFDKQVDVFNLLKKRGVNILSDFSKGGYHGIFLSVPDKSKKFLEFVRSVFYLYVA